MKTKQRKNKMSVEIILYFFKTAKKYYKNTQGS